jgi:hypothetical protein
VLFKNLPNPIILPEKSLPGLHKLMQRYLRPVIHAKPPPACHRICKIMLMYSVKPSFSLKNGHALPFFLVFRPPPGVKMPLQACGLVADAPETLAHPCGSLSDVPESMLHPCNGLSGVPETLPHPCSGLSDAPESLLHPCSGNFSI